MRFCVSLPQSNEFNHSVDDRNSVNCDFYPINIYEYIFYLYKQFKLEKNDVETVIPLFYSESIKEIILKNCEEKTTDNFNDFLSKCNIVNFEGILKRIAVQIECNELLKKQIFVDSVFLLKSNNLESLEKQFIDFLMKNDHQNIIDQTCFNRKLTAIDFSAILESIKIDDDVIYENEIMKAFLGYLSIAVNTRDQVRFSYIFNVPDRKLNHHAFTNLRHESDQKKLSMAQVAISYVTRLKLGGKSYAPAEDCSLKKYVYGLSELVKFINKIQSKLEDAFQNSNKVAIIKGMLNIVQSALQQEQYPRFKKNHIGFLKDKLVANVERIMAHDFITICDNNSSPNRQVMDIIRSLLADYAIRPFEYGVNQDLCKLGSPAMCKTPKGGCSRNISLLYMSPDTCDSPIPCKKPKTSVDLLAIERESETLPAWPVHAKYQSNLDWTRYDLTPPNVVRRLTRNIPTTVTKLNLNDSIDEDLFEDIPDILDIPICDNFHVSEGSKGSPTKSNTSPKQPHLTNKHTKVAPKSKKPPSKTSAKRGKKPDVNQKLITSFFSK